jgi:hypothetical protein
MMQIEKSRTHGGARPGAGRPRGSPASLSFVVRERAAEHCGVAIACLRELTETSASEATRLTASMALLSAALGKPLDAPKINHAELPNVGGTPNV